MRLKTVCWIIITGLCVTVTACLLSVNNSVRVGCSNQSTALYFQMLRC